MSKEISILVVDDDPRIRLALEYNLKQDGFKVYVAEDGVDCLRLAKGKKPDLILLDWMMPEMDGIETLRKLRQNKTTMNIPVFMCTAKGAIGDIDKSFAVGVDYYITKPFDIWTLGDTIRKKLEQLKSAV